MARKFGMSGSSSDADQYLEEKAPFLKALLEAFPANDDADDSDESEEGDTSEDDSEEEAVDSADSDDNSDTGPAGEDE